MRLFSSELGTDLAPLFASPEAQGMEAALMGEVWSWDLSGFA